MYKNIREAYERFKEAGVEEPLAETMHLLDLLAGGSIRKLDRTVLENGDACLEIIRKRSQGTMPMEYLMGKAVFMGNEFHCTQDTLIPTEDTDLLVQVAASHAQRLGRPGAPCTIIEIGTGCGNVAVSLALQLDDARILASDISSEAVAVARRNVDKFGVGGKVTLFCGDMFAPFEDLGCRGAVDLVVCNPPYIPTTSLAKLAAEIVDHEPLVALDGGPYGINAYKRLVGQAGQFLSPGGMLLMEIGERQEKLVERLFNNNGGYEQVVHFRKHDKIRVMGARRN
jgi:release factor glutamine methyltransferase